MPRFVTTKWEVITHYDVWGNAKDGYEVNDSMARLEPIALRLAVQTANPGTPQEFSFASPTDAQIRRVFDVPRVRLETDGDDLCIEVSRDRDGYPIGRLVCVSHESLSPIRAKQAQG